MASSDAYIVASMPSVIVVPVDGVDLKDEKELKKINQVVDNKLKDIINNLKQTHEKFTDKDFGPMDTDEFGAKSFYGNAPPNPAGSKYPAPDTLKWERPQYSDGVFAGGEEGEAKKGGGGTDGEGSSDEVGDDGGVEEEEEDFDDEFGAQSYGDDEDAVWCKQGNLFVDGSSSGDVIQGQLGDCWFLSALAVMGAHENLLETCFYKGDSFKEYGLYVVRFYKDCNLVFVIIDDRIPVKVKDNRVIFATNKDPNELWVPLIEKGYAKLHGCYKALIGGFTHFGLADMTGFCPRLLVMRKGYLGYSEDYEEEELWSMLTRYKDWKSLMGCSIQSNPKDKTHKVEADAGMGLHMGHAYSLLDLGEIHAPKHSSRKDGKLRLLKVRNPWGKGEWEGPFGDRSDEREEYDAEIVKAFHTTPQEEIVQDFNDGTFFISFDDWRKHYTNLFVAVNFPPSFVGRRTQGSWNGETGGNRSMGTWISNPKIKFRIESGKRGAQGEQEYRQVFVGIYIKDSRLVMGADYFKDPLYATPITFDIVTEEYFNESKCKSGNKDEFVPNGYRYNPHISNGSSATQQQQLQRAKQPPYNFGTTQLELFLRVDTDYYIVPSLYKRGQPGTFFVTAFADCEALTLDSHVNLDAAQKPMVLGNKPMKMSVAQFYEKKEQLRDKLVSEMKRLGIAVSTIESVLSDGGEDGLPRSGFKRRMMDLGFNLADIPDEDLVILDPDNDGTITASEFVGFIKDGLQFADSTQFSVAPEPPIDDLLLKANDLEGVLRVKVMNARYLREAATWFNTESHKPETSGSNPSAGGGGGRDAPSEGAAATTTQRKVLKYDPATAAETHARMWKDRKLANDAAIAQARAAKVEQQSSLLTHLSGAAGAAGIGGAGVVGSYPITSIPEDQSATTARLNIDTDSLVMSPDRHTMGTQTAPTTAVSAIGQNHYHHHLPLPLPLTQRNLSSLAASNGSIISKHGGGGGTLDHRLPPHRASDAISIASMSVSMKEVTQKAGMDAAIKLHSDAVLQKAEIARTKNLSALRSMRKHAQAGSGGGPGTASVASQALSKIASKNAPEEGVLRRKGKPSRRVEKRSILDDPSAMRLLNYRPTVDELLLHSAAGTGLRSPMAITLDGNTSGFPDNTTPAAAEGNNALVSTFTPPRPGGRRGDNIAFDPMTPATPGSAETYSPSISSPSPMQRMGVSTSAGFGNANQNLSKFPSKNGKSHKIPLIKTNSVCANLVPPSVTLDLVPDIWDYLIDCVVTIASSRPKNARATEKNKAILSMKNHRMTAEKLTVFMPIKTPLPAPSRRSVPSRHRKGHAATPRSVRKTPGAASVFSRLGSVTGAGGGGAAGRQQQNVMTDAREKLRAIEEEQRNTFEEVYRRLVSVPVTSFAEMEGDRTPLASDTKSATSTDSLPFITSLFRKMDKNNNGLVSKDEFRQLMEEINVGLSPDDVDIFFNRFGAISEGGIDFPAFIKFFNDHIIGSSASAGSGGGGGSGSGLGGGSSSNGTGKYSPTTLIQSIAEIKAKLQDVVNEMIARRVPTLDAYFTSSSNDRLAHVLSEQQQQYPVGSTGAGSNSLLNGSENGKGVEESKAATTTSVAQLNGKPPLSRGLGMSIERKPFVLHDNALFHNLADAAQNCRALRKLGIHISEGSMARIARIFRNDVSLFMGFIKQSSSAPGSSTESVTGGVRGEGGENTAGEEIFRVLELADAEILEGFHQRFGVGALNAGTKSMTKLWTSLAPNVKSTVTFDTVTQYLCDLLADVMATKAKVLALSRVPSNNSISRQFAAAVAPAAENPNKGVSEAKTAQMSEETPRSATQHAQQQQQSQHQRAAKLSILGVRADIVCRIIADTLIYSNWNKPVSSVSAATGSSVGSNHVGNSGSSGAADLRTMLSYSGMDAYVRNAHIKLVERKLQYLMKLEANLSCTSINLLVHVLINKSRNEMVILAHDPITGEVYKFDLKEDTIQKLPTRDALEKLFLDREKHLEFRSKVARMMDKDMKYLVDPSMVYNPDSSELYNPWDTPAEDAAITEIVKRLRIVRSVAGSNTGAVLMLAEEPKFLTQIKALLDISANSLPFFSVVNDMTLLFEADKEALRTHNSIRSFIFGQLRSQRALYNFLTGVFSSLKVVLTTYNAGIRETFDWSEMLAHLTNYRNPFATVQLLPRFLTPEEYYYQPVDNTTAFTGEEEEDPLAVQKGPVDIDGAPNPTWGHADFKFEFQPPKLTACRVLSKEVAKMKIEEVYKYVIVMVRAGKSTADKKPFRFLTIYDPRSATEYQCGIKPGCELHKRVFQAPYEAHSMELDDFTGLVAQAVETEHLILGPAVTPHILVNVYNDNGKTSELLGSAQMSISSVLSGSGVSDPQWVTLTFKQDIVSGRDSSNSNSTSIHGSGGEKVPADVKAGDVQIELGFRKKADIEAEAQAAKEHLDRMSASGVGAGAGDRDAAPPQQREQQQEPARASASAVSERMNDAGNTSSTPAPPLRGTNIAGERSGADAVPASTGQDTEQQQQQEAMAKLLASFEALRMENESLKSKEKSVERSVEMMQKELAAYEERLKKAAEDNERLKRETADAVAAAEAEAKAAKLTATAAAGAGRGGTGALESGAPPLKLSEEPAVGVREPETLEKAVSAILSELLDRHQTIKRSQVSGGGSSSSSGGSSGSQLLKPLEGFQRLLNTYAKSDGQVSSKDIIATLSELGITVPISTEMGMKLVREVGPTTPGGTSVLVTHVIDYLQGELTPMMAAAGLNRQQQRRPSSASFSASSPHNNHRRKSSSLSVPQSPRTSAAVASAAAATAEPLRNSASGVSLKGDLKGSLKGVSEAPVLNPVVPAPASNGSNNKPGNNKPRPASAVPKIERDAIPTPAPPLDKTEKSRSNGNLRASRPERPERDTGAAGQKRAGSDAGAGTPKDWSKVPLPSRDWEQVYHKDSNRYVYMNHVTKSTQWYHPSDPSQGRTKK